MKQRAREAASTALLEAAEHVAAERGIDQTSIAAIAERAQVAVGTLYNYFPDRESLFAALFKWRRDEMVPRMLAAAATAGENDGPFEQRLNAYMIQISRAFDGFRLFCRVAISADQSGTPIKGRATGGKSVILETFLTNLVGIMRPIYGDKSEEFARMMFGAFKGMMQYQLERDQPIEGSVPALVETFLRGMAV
jgi:AcrR family transcriptional regulator